MPRCADEVRQQLDQVTAVVFDTMMELRCEPVAEAADTSREVCARVSFLGPLQGCCTVRLRRSGAVALVRAMLQVTILPGDELGEDAVRELCNMIAGGWKSGLEADACAAEMTPPTLCEVAAQGPPATVARRYSFAGNLLDVELRLHCATA